MRIHEERCRNIPHEYIARDKNFNNAEVISAQMAHGRIR